MIETLAAWRAEIAAELQTAQADLAAAEAELDRSAEAWQAARSQRADLAGRLAIACIPEQLASAISFRMRAHSAGLFRQSAGPVLARGMIGAARSRVADLSLALDQLGRIGVPVPDRPEPEAVPDRPEPEAVPDRSEPEALAEPGRIWVPPIDPVPDRPEPEAAPDRPEPEALAELGRIAAEPAA